MQKLYYLNLSYNKIAMFPFDNLPESLIILKLWKNPCVEKCEVEDYRKIALLALTKLEDLDDVPVNVAERMHYQGVVKIDVSKYLSKLKEKKQEEELKSKLEDELMQEYLEESGLDRKEQKEKNWDAFQSLSEFKELNDGFLKIKKRIDRNRDMVRIVTFRRKELLYDHYQKLEQNYDQQNEVVKTEEDKMLMKNRDQLRLKMAKLKEEIDKEKAEIEDLDDLEEEESEDEEEKDPKLDDFEILKMKVRAKMPKKLAAKGILSNLTPIEEDSMDEMSFSEIKINKDKFDELTNEEKRAKIAELMRNPTLEEALAKGMQEEEVTEEGKTQNEEIQKKLVKLAKHVETGEVVALKIMKEMSVDLELVRNEISILQDLNHPNIVNLIGWSEEAILTQPDGQEIPVMYIALELATNGDLCDLIILTGRFIEDHARYYFHQMLEGLDHLHSQGISHRDLKPDNMMLDDE